MARLIQILIVLTLCLQHVYAATNDSIKTDIADRRFHVLLYTGAHMTGITYRIPAAPLTDLQNFDEKCFGAGVAYTVLMHLDIMGEVWAYGAIAGSDPTGQVNCGAAGAGLEVRRTFPEVAGLFNPFLQSGLFYHDMTLDAPELDWHFRGSGWGYSAGGGLDFQIGRHFSIPVFFMYHQCRKDYDFTGFEFNYGIGVHF